MFVALLTVAACYLIGAVPFPIIVSRLVKGIDIREHGSGNMGAMNIARVLGKQWFPVVFGLDFAKGALAALVGRMLLPDQLGVDPVVAAAIGAFAAVVGHCYPVYVGFKGGLGLAASAGALFVISPWLMLVVAVSILPLWALTRDMYVGVALAAVGAPGLTWLFFRDGQVVLAVAVWALVVVIVHVPDVRAWYARLRQS